jgi:hypothetical protein
VAPVAKSICATLAGEGGSTSNLVDVVLQLEGFLGLVADEARAGAAGEALEESTCFFATTEQMSAEWAERFNCVARLINVGATLKLIADANAALFVSGLPAHMRDFGLAHCMAALSTPETARQRLAALLGRVEQQAEAEAWFLVALVLQEHPSTALQLAADSPRAAQLLPRIRRAWLCNAPEEATAAVSASAVAGDAVAEMLAHPPGAQRVAYLKQITQDGTRTLPGSLWVSEKHEEKKGFWASLFGSGKSIDEITSEYVKRNPLYSSYRVDAPERDRFKEYLRFSGYGEYGHEFVDKVLLETLVAWSDVSGDQVARLLHAMWQAMRPEDDILKLDFLRNSIFVRITTVSAAVPDALAADFLPWLKRTLIDRTLQWQIGNTQFTLNYPQTALASMCMQSALQVHEISPARRDRLVEMALTRYPAEEQDARLGGMLYNTGKSPLDLRLPWQTKSRVLDGWQLGVAANALEALVEALVEEMPDQGPTQK